MNKIKLGYSNDADCLSILTGVMEPARKNKINNLLLHNIFTKNYNVTDFCQKLSTIINGNQGKVNVCLCLDSAPFNELTEELKILIPKEAKNAGNYINRFAPEKNGGYIQMLMDLIKVLKTDNLLPYISWELWQEPNSKRYYWGSLFEFDEWIGIKFNLMSLTNRPIYVADFTSALISSGSVNQPYMDWINATTIFNEPNVYFSQSFYWKTSKGMFNFDNNSRPLGLSNTTVQYNYWAATGQGVEQAINSPIWMVYMVKFLRNIVIYNWNVDIIYFFCLIDCNDRDSKGVHAAWKKNSNGSYSAKPLWTMQLELANILKQPDNTFGYELIENGIKGYNKSIVISEDSYTVINN